MEKSRTRLVLQVGMARAKCRIGLLVGYGAGDGGLKEFSGPDSDIAVKALRDR